MMDVANGNAGNARRILHQRARVLVSCWALELEREGVREGMQVDEGSCDLARGGIVKGCCSVIDRVEDVNGIRGIRFLPSEISKAVRSVGRVGGFEHACEWDVAVDLLGGTRFDMCCST